MSSWEPPKESKVMREIMVLASRIGMHLFRNNSGQYKTDAGHWVRYGLANPGGSDCIGWRPLIITSDMVGQTIAQFTAVEVKSESGKLSKEQETFLGIVNQCGGCGIVARSTQEAIVKLTVGDRAI